MASRETLQSQYGWSTQEISNLESRGQLDDILAALTAAEAAPAPILDDPIPRPEPESAAAGNLNSIGAIIAAGNRGALSAQQAFDALMALLGPGAWQQAARLILKADFPDSPVSVLPGGVVVLDTPAADLTPVTDPTSFSGVGDTAQTAKIQADLEAASRAEADRVSAAAQAQAEQDRLDAMAQEARALDPNATVGPFTRYLMSFGIGAGPQTSAQAFVGRGFEEIQRLQEAQAAIRGFPSALNPTGLPQEIDEFAAGIRNPTQAREVGAGLLTDLAGLTPAEREEGGLLFDLQYDPAGRQFTQKGLGRKPMSVLTDLVQSGLANRFGIRGAEFLANRVPYYQQRFEREGGDQGVPGAFLTNLLQRFGVGG